MLLASRYYVSFALLILFLFKAGPTGAQPLLLNRNVSVFVSDMPLNAVLQKLSRETGIRFSYDPDLILPKRQITLSVTNKPLGDVLNMLLGNTGFAYHEIGNQLVIYRQNKETEAKKPELKQTDQVKVPPATGKKGQLPDTIIITRTDTIHQFRTDTVVRTETVILHDTVRHTDTIYMYRTQKSGRNNLPDFSRNSVRNQKFREHNGFYTGITYQQMIGKASFDPTSGVYNDLKEAMIGASPNSAMNFSLGAVAGYDYRRFGIQSGLGFTRVGEPFEYSYTKQIGGYYRTDTLDSYYTLSGIDTSWYYVTDSSWVNIDYKKFIYKNQNSYRYIEIPVLVKFRLLQGDRLDIYVSGGLLANILLGSHALYIKPDDEKSVDWILASELKPVLFSWQAGIGVAYTIADGMGVLLEVSYRNQFTSQYKDYPLTKKFELVNIKTGIFVRL
jgi:hypothetical protein